MSTPLAAGGAGDFQKFSLGGAGKFLVYRGAGPLRKLQNFDEFGKNVLEKFSKIE